MYLLHRLGYLKQHFLHQKLTIPRYQPSFCLSLYLEKKPINIFEFFNKLSFEININIS